MSRARTRLARDGVAAKASIPPEAYETAAAVYAEVAQIRHVGAWFGLPVPVASAAISPRLLALGGAVVVCRRRRRFFLTLWR